MRMELSYLVGGQLEKVISTQWDGVDNYGRKMEVETTKCLEVREIFKEEEPRRRVRNVWPEKVGRGNL